MTIKKQLLINIGIPFILSLLIALTLVMFITSRNISKEVETSIIQQNSLIVDNMANLVSSYAESYMRAISDITRIDPSIINNIATKNFLINGYIYLVNKEGIIMDHPDKNRIGTESVNKTWLLSEDFESSGFYKYIFEDREKLLYKYFNKSLNMFVLTSAYIDDFSNAININDLRTAMDRIKIGNTGYPFIINSEGLCLTHQDKQYIDKTLTDLKDADGNYIIQRVLEEKNGNFRYNWLSKDGKLRAKNLYYSYDKTSKLIICSTGYIDEYYKTFNTTIKIVILCSLIILIISSLILFNVAESFVKPIELLSELSIEITKGNLNQVFVKGNTKEINTLGKNFLFMQNSIRFNLETLEDAIEEKTNELEKAQAHLIQSEKMSSLGSLVAGVAHEINTPVGIGVTAASHLEKETRQFLEMYKNGKMTKTAFEKYMSDTTIEAQILLTNMNRAATLVQSFKKVSVDQAIELKRQFNIKDYINDLLISLKHKLKSKNIDIIIHCDDDMEIISYPGPISQILTNLILNSYIHGFDNISTGEIHIVISIINNHINLKYYDNGLGIQEDIMSKIFDPFFTTKRNKGGTGLGLHLVYNIVVSTLNGTISCNNRFNGGTEFIIIFPMMA